MGLMDIVWIYLVISQLVCCYLTYRAISSGATKQYRGSAKYFWTYMINCLRIGLLWPLYGYRLLVRK